MTRFGQFNSVAGPGLHLRIPFVNGLETFPVNIQRMTKDHLNTYTIDNQELDAAVTLNYRISENDVRRVYTTNRDYRANLESFMIDRFKREMGKINITQVAAHRGDVALSVQKSLVSDAMDLFGITIVDFQINDIRYTEQYRRAVDVGSDCQSQGRAIRAGTPHGRGGGPAPEDRGRGRGQRGARNGARQGRRRALPRDRPGQRQGAGRSRRGQGAGGAGPGAVRSNSSLIQLEFAKRWSGNLPVNMYGSAPLPLLNLTPDSQAPPAAAPAR